ncbi:MAG TPA: hypothetical protein VHA56_22385 [Mucilaginibacter sp.]|nr:hypothetical protein [Mucilaginibacter sp.]
MMNPNKNPTVKGRKFHGTPYLKLKRVETSPPRTLKQRLRDTVALAAAQLKKEPHS